jgi:hypothetical protein
MPRYSKLSLFFRFSHQNPICISPVHHPGHTHTCTAHLIILDVNLIMNSDCGVSHCSVSSNFLLLCPIRFEYFPGDLVLEKESVMFFHHCFPMRYKLCVPGSFLLTEVFSLCICYLMPAQTLTYTETGSTSI